MSSWFRSKDMTYVSIIINEDAALSCMSAIGKLGVIQFTDLNPELTPFQRRYVTYIKRIDELERKVKFFADEMHKFGLHAMYQGEVQPFLDIGGSPDLPRSGIQLLETLENIMEKEETTLNDLNLFSERLTAEYNEKIEFQEVLLGCRDFFAAQSEAPTVEEGSHAEGGTYQAGIDIEGGSRGSDLEPRALIQRRGGAEIRFSYIGGVVNQVERTGEEIQKVTFLVIFKSTAIEGKIKKICDAFEAKRYVLPDFEDVQVVQKQLDDNYNDLVDSRTILQKNRDARLQICTAISSQIEIWSWTILREKASYHALNAFKPDVKGMLRGEGWVVSDYLPSAQHAVRSAHESMGKGVPSYLEVLPEPWPTPPTYFETNAFTLAFQEFVDTYGVPRYKEANPALFAAATFPFLYGVMYGDIGHGMFIFLFGLYLIISHNFKPKGRRAGNDEGMLGSMYMARYMLTMMGFFSVYIGMVYNDFFAIAVNFFGTKYTWDLNTAAEGDEATLVDGVYGDSSSVYPFGIDPSWHVSDNELLFYNSLKMKMSVILGIIQMTVGILLKASNAHYFSQPLDFFFEFLPMIIFDLCLFGYMVFLIFLKWSINWEDRMYQATCLSSGYTPSNVACTSDDTTADLCPLDYGGTGDGCQPPNLISTLINMALSPGSVDEPMYKGQSGVQVVLILVAVLCIPVLLVGKPLCLKYQMSRVQRRNSESSGAALVHGEHHVESHEEHNFSEIVIHQAIETIEFVLGMVSNTASYLRLWALSLAHTELATVFWEKALLVAIETENAVFIFVGFAVWLAVTFGVILCMDVLECFLHALRLHWVEFQNKFYKADGYKFQPFSFHKLLENSPRY